MSETRRRFDPEFRAGAVRIVLESGRAIAQVARELGINEGTLGNWVARDRQARGGAEPPVSESERAELVPGTASGAAGVPACGRRGCRGCV